MNPAASASINWQVSLGTQSKSINKMDGVKQLLKMVKVLLR